MEAVAVATGRPLALDPAALAMVEARSPGAAGPTAGGAGPQREAGDRCPAGATVLPPVGTAPGAAFAQDGTVVVVLPGPPWELEAMWEAARRSRRWRACSRRGGGPAERVLRLHGVPESRAVAALEGLDRGAWARLRVGICAREAELEVTVRSAPGDALGRRRPRGPARRRARRRPLQPRRRHVDEIVARGLLAGGETVAVAESCTGGGLGARLTARPGSSAYVLGGVISYADAVKRDVLGVEAELLRRHGAVSGPVAERMAAGVRDLVGSDWALSITGVAGPAAGDPREAGGARLRRPRRAGRGRGAGAPAAGRPGGHPRAVGGDRPARPPPGAGGPPGGVTGRVTPPSAARVGAGGMRDGRPG